VPSVASASLRFYNENGVFYRRRYGLTPLVLAKEICDFLNNHCGDTHL
jgi:hypothetical protein